MYHLFFRFPQLDFRLDSRVLVAAGFVSALAAFVGAAADDLCLVRSMFTEQFNHAPAQLFVHTGAARQGRPGMGAWLTYGLGSESQDLPAFVVLVSQGSGNKGDQPLYDRLWGSGFLPTQYQGVKFRSVGDPDGLAAWKDGDPFNILLMPVQYRQLFPGFQLMDANRRSEMHGLSAAERREARIQQGQANARPRYGLGAFLSCSDITSAMLLSVMARVSSSSAQRWRPPARCPRPPDWVSHCSPARGYSPPR